MPDQKPVLSVIVRRYKRKYENEIETSLHKLQEAATKHPGYLGEQNSLSHGEKYCEMVTVFAFDSRANLKKWETSQARNEHIKELDQHPQEISKHQKFDDLALLLRPEIQISKIEIVLILICWILLLGAVLQFIADLVWPETLLPFLRYVALISINVVLISYFFLPWTSSLLTKLKMALRRK